MKIFAIRKFMLRASLISFDKDIIISTNFCDLIFCKDFGNTESPSFFLSHYLTL